MFRSAFAVGAAELLGCVLCFFAVATFVSSVLARREKGYRGMDLIMIGGIAAGLTASGLSMALWSGFRIYLYGVTIQGTYWAITGVCIAAPAAKKRDAF
jgi:hypothetical protein